MSRPYLVHQKIDIFLYLIYYCGVHIFTYYHCATTQIRMTEFTVKWGHSDFSSKHGKSLIPFIMIVTWSSYTSEKNYHHQEKEEYAHYTRNVSAIFYVPQAIIIFPEWPAKNKRVYYQAWSLTYQSFCTNSIHCLDCFYIGWASSEISTVYWNR